MGLSNEMPRDGEASVRSARRTGKGARVVLPVSGLPPGVGDVFADECGVLMVEGSQRFEAARGRPADSALDDPAFQEEVLTATLRRTLASGFPRTTVMWLGAHRNGPWAIGSALRAAVRAGRLIPMQWRGDAARQIEVRGAERVLKDLGICGLRRREALVIDACAPWLSPEIDARTLTRLAAALLMTCRRLHQGPVLGIVPARHCGERLADHFESLTWDDCPGAPWSLATLHAEDGVHPMLEIHQWPALDGPAVNHRVFGLVQRRVAGRSKVGWQADGSALAMDAQILLGADDAQRVIAVASVAESRFGPPVGWEVVNTADDLETLCRHAVAATVILPYAQAEEFPALAQRVHRLRTAHPRALKIIVRELGERLRHGQESVLLRLGANQVVYRDVSLSRLEQAVVELRERLFGRPPVLAPQSLIDAIAPEPLRGYLPVQPFCATARRMLARAMDAKLGHSLLSLTLRPSVAHLDALAAFQFERDGDLVTAGAEGLHLFLFGCQQADAQGTLARLLRVPVSDIASNVALVTATLDINMALESVAAQAHVSPPTDWTGALRTRSDALAQLLAEAGDDVTSGELAPSPHDGGRGGSGTSAPVQRDGLQLPPGTRVLTPHVLAVREPVR